jgi:uncharacterized membrane protein YraQ (UPF0718 family)
MAKSEVMSPARPNGWQKWVGRFIIAAIAGVFLGWLATNGTFSDILSGRLTASEVWGRFLTLTTIFLGIFIEAAAFLLLGVLMSAVIQVFVTPDMLERWVPKNRFGASLMGAFMGLIFPVCECGSVPAARRLMSKGAPVPLGVAFLLAAPVINPIVILSTWEAFGGDPWIVFGRLGFTALIAVVIALVFSFHPQPQSLLMPAACPVPDDHHHDHEDDHEHDHDHHHHHDDRPKTWSARGKAIADHSATEFFEMGQFVVFGALIAAIAQTIIPREVLLAIGGNPVTSVLVMMGLAVLLSICSTVDAFVALSFANTFGTGSILAFLVYGPMIDIKAVLLFTTTLKKHAVVLLVVLATLLAFLTAIWVNLNVG